MNVIAADRCTTTGTSRARLLRTARSKAAVLAALACAALLPACAQQPLRDAGVPANFDAFLGSVAPSAPEFLPAPSAEESSSSLAEANLPDAPAPQIQNTPLQAATPPSPPPAQGQEPIAPLYWKYIPAGYVPQKIDGHDKVVIGFRDLYSAGNFAAMFLSAGYEQLTNTEPHYGTDRGAFGERLGAAAVRESSEGIFTDAIFAPLFHQDPRYFEEGPSYGFVHRVLYAVTRVVETRDDSGHESLNGSLLVGYAASSALTLAYYPSQDRTAGYPLATYAGALGGAALGFVVDEFADQVLQKIHLEKKP